MYLQSSTKIYTIYLMYTIYKVTYSIVSIIEVQVQLGSFKLAIF